MSMCSVCTRRVFGGIEYRTQAFRSGESDVLTTRLPTFNEINSLDTQSCSTKTKKGVLNYNSATNVFHKHFQ
ncbi:hypothetical protein TNCV_2769501 [Trichonephila clavipes]|nr:hypothetical protein TNCV_2769501 [Trichonephila clavipes]